MYDVLETKALQLLCDGFCDSKTVDGLCTLILVPPVVGPAHAHVGTRSSMLAHGVAAR